MEKVDSGFNEHDVLHELKHYLPAQSPLKDFIHHNTLHAFQHQKFFTALRNSSKIFGYKTSLALDEFRRLYVSGRIREDVLSRVLRERMGKENVNEWKSKLLSKKYDMTTEARVGKLRSQWEVQFGMDLDVLVHPPLFRIICSYLDQGISIWNFPVLHKGFLNSIREIEKNSYASFFKSKRAKNLLRSRCKISDLLKIVVGDPALYKQYLYDQQFAHQGWSGMVSAIEDFPETLLDTKRVSLKDLIILELLLEIDALDQKFGEIWSPLGFKVEERPEDIFSEVPQSEYDTVLSLWQDAYEWSYYDDVLYAIASKPEVAPAPAVKTFQAMLCIDDRELSFRDYMEKVDPACETFGTPGFFGVEFYFQPEHGKSYTKQCPAPVFPKYLIKEIDISEDRKKDVHLTNHTHSLFKGWIMAPTLGFWSAFRLFLSIFKPSMSPATSSSFNHMDKVSKLSINFDEKNAKDKDLQIGYTVDEMATRVEGLLKSIGLVEHFAPFVYVIGHGASSANNPHYAAYNCGACSGRAGSVNARVVCNMANHAEVRAILSSKGLAIPDSTTFIGALHDTTRDEMVFYDENLLSEEKLAIHTKNVLAINQALEQNARERARRFELIDLKLSPREIHKKILTRSVSLFEPRPELNHATNALCIVGRRLLTKNLFLDRRAFANSYDYRIDADGTILTNIMKPLGPVCGGINLEYYFSRVDNEKLGAGTKLPHNVMGLFGVANGFDGDLRPGLPNQMTEVHDPVRLLIVVEHFPEIVLKTIKSADAVYEWYINEWIHLVALNPETKQLFEFRDGEFVLYQPLSKEFSRIQDVSELLTTRRDNLPVFVLD
ncbi:MAG: DUF2309 domain-containing protein [bacterium]|nr:DUF2309 domain-containing protein [bacterium]